jgi:hypothetical protein
MLRTAGWVVAVEVTFSIRGERGAVDLLGWHASSRILLLVEAKSVVPDQQSMLAALDRKVRLGFEIGRERGWPALAVAKLLVFQDSRTSRRRVGAFAETYRIAFPDRSRAVREWLGAPVASRPMAGLLFLSDVHGASTRHRVARRGEGLRA